MEMSKAPLMILNNLANEFDCLGSSVVEHFPEEEVAGSAILPPGTQ